MCLLSMYLMNAFACRYSALSSGLSVKNTECWDVVRLQLGWFINQACPNDAGMTSFIRNLLSRTISSISFFPVLSISLRRERGTKIAKGTSFRMYSGYPGRYYAVLRNTVVIPAIFGSKFEDVARKIGSN